MNIQQMRYVAAIANNGSFREAARKLYVSQPSLSHAIKELESELNIQLFERTNQGAVLTAQGIEFLRSTQPILAQVELVENRYLSEGQQEKQFSIASQHYDFLSVIFSHIMEEYPHYTNLRIFESTTLNIIKDVEQYRSELGILVWNETNQAGLGRLLEAAAMEYEELLSFETQIFLGEHHPLAQKNQITLEDLVDYPQVRFTQETNNYTYYAEDLVEFPGISQVVYTSDRATLTGILQKTNAYASGSGLVENSAAQKIVFVPLKDAPKNHLIAIKKRERVLSTVGESVLKQLKNYFQTVYSGNA